MQPGSDAAELSKLIAEWTERLNGKDIHSIQRQVNTMLARSAFYRSINESRKLLKSGNGSLHGLINDGYVCMQAAAVRRLVDRGSYSGAKGVNSLVGLLNDIERACPLLTRGSLLAARGLVYDYAPILQDAMVESASEARKRGKTSSMVPMAGWSESEYWHGVWDELCDIDESARSPADRPSAAKVRALASDLSAAAKHVEEYANKHIAHAASNGSRQSLPQDYRSLSLATLWTAERAIVRVTGFLRRCFGDGASGGGVPVPQFDQFQFLDQPFVTPAARPAMDMSWNAHSNEIEACADWDWSMPLVAATDRWE